MIPKCIGGLLDHARHAVSLLCLRDQLRPIIPYPTGRFFFEGRFPGTSCLATISLSLRDKSHSLIEGHPIKLALIGRLQPTTTKKACTNRRRLVYILPIWTIENTSLLQPLAHHFFRDFDLYRVIHRFDMTAIGIRVNLSELCAK